MKVTVTNIVYKAKSNKKLPETMELELSGGSDVESQIAAAISDKTGCCAQGYNYEVIYWRDIKTVPLNQAVLIAWGSKSFGAMGHEVATFDGKKWSENYTEGYIPLAWMPLPSLPWIPLQNKK